MKTPVRLLAILALAGASAAFAQGYPNHPIKVVVPWPPGQATDLAARMVSENAPDEFGEFIKTQKARYGSMVTQANVRLD